jgi:spore coat polysaccharide biosynthesis predicted glycosyltransferase SpsG
VLNPDVARYRRARLRFGSTVVSIGGSDTHGATAGVVRILAARGKTATVVLGPGFVSASEFERSLPPGFEIRRNVTSLPAEFARHDLGVTGGGVTAFEAAAAGLPTIVIANETHEVGYARYLEGIGCSVFAGPQFAIRPETFDRHLDIPAMSRAGLEGIGAHGVERVLDEVLAL